MKEDMEAAPRAPVSGIREPLINNSEASASVAIKKLESGNNSCESKESIWMVIISTMVAVCGSFEFGLCMGYTSPIQSAMISDLGLSTSEFSVFGSILNFGAMLGSVMGGKIADHIGRKGAMRLAAVVCIIGWLLIYFSQTTIILDTGRFLTGYGIAIFSYVVPVFIAEITPKNLRGSFTTLNQLLICSGVSYVYIVGTVITWRTLGLTAIVPCILLLVGLFFIPESPRYLAKSGCSKEFEDALRTLRGKDADISREAEDIQDNIQTLEHLPKATLGDLFRKKYFRLVIIGVGLMGFQQFGGINAVIFYSSKTFESAGFASGALGVIILGCIQVPMTTLGAILMDKSGRKQLLLISVSGLFIGSLLTGFAFYWKAHSFLAEWDAILTLTGILVFVALFSLGMGPIPWVIMSEIFPLNIKGIAGSLVTFEHWIGAWVLSYFFNFLATWSSAGTYFIFAAINALALVFIVMLVPETKGRTLEELQIAMGAAA